MEAACRCRSKPTVRVRGKSIRTRLALLVRPLHMMANILFSVVVTLAVSGLATTARADPSPFSNLSCSCQLPAGLSHADPDPILEGIQDGLSHQQPTIRRLQ